MLTLSEPYKKRPVRFLGFHHHKDWRIKLYSITYPGTPDESKLREVTKQLMADHLPDPSEEGYGAGFAIMHNGKGSNFILLDWWINENELRQKAFFSSKENPTDVRLQTDTDPIACAWDLAVIGHERNAWVKHILKNYPNPNLEAYLQDTLETEI